MYPLVSKTSQRVSNEEIPERERLQNREVGFFHSFGFCKGWAPLLFCSSIFPGSHRIHFQEAFSRRVKRPTAPWPFPWMPHQTLLNEDRMHVLQFLPQLFSGVDIEIVVSPLPESSEFSTRFTESH